MYDIVIRNGHVVDGSGLGRYRADVGVIGDRIATIGRIRERGATEIEADGMVVTPGFIDGHTHFDAQIFWDPLGTNSCWHGVTTAVMGHCGFTLAPSSEAQAALVVRNLERAEDISGKAMAEGIRWSWTTFAEYLDTVDALPKGINYAANLGHSALRTYVMGEAAFERDATSDELTAMTAELTAAIEAGAIGFTTSRTKHHQTADDRPVASRLAPWAEIEHLVRTMGSLGSYLFQMVEDRPSDAEERRRREDELIALAVETGVTFALGAQTGAPVVLPILDRCAERGGRMFGLAHPRGIGALSSFRSQLPFDRLPGWKEFRALPLEEQRRRLQDPAVVEELVRAAAGPFGEAFGAEARPPDYDRMKVMSAPVPPYQSVTEAAHARGLDPVSFIIERSLETDLSQLFVQTFSPFDHDDVATILRHPHVVMAFSDAGAHVSQMSDASIQTHLLAHWVRDRQEFTFEDAIRMLTLAPARAWGFHDRGMVREGLLADLNVIDPATVAPAMPRVVHDLPAGERRLEQKAVGIAATIVNGAVLVRDGEPTGALPGRLLRRPSSARVMEARDAILAAAKELFAGRSPSRVSLREIATKAGVNYGLIHHYFGTKDAILAALVQEASAAGAARMDGTTTVDDALAVLLDGNGSDAHARMLAWSILEEVDLSSLVEASPAIAHLATTIASDQGEEIDARIAAAAIVSAVLGWRMFAPFVREAAELGDRPAREVDQDVVAAIVTMAGAFRPTTSRSRPATRTPRSR